MVKTKETEMERELKVRVKVKVMTVFEKEKAWKEEKAKGSKVSNSSLAQRTDCSEGAKRGADGGNRIGR